MKARPMVCVCTAVAAFGVLFAQNGNILRCSDDTIYTVPPGSYFLLYGMVGQGELKMNGQPVLYGEALSLSPPMRFEAGTVFHTQTNGHGTVYGYEGSLTDIGEPSDEAVARSVLGVPMPSPWSSRAHLTYEVPKSAPVVLRIVDVSGRTVTTLQEGTMRPGFYAATWDGRNEAAELASAGTYFFILSVDGQEEIRKTVFIGR